MLAIDNIAAVVALDLVNQASDVGLFNKATAGSGYTGEALVLRVFRIPIMVVVGFLGPHSLIPPRDIV